MYFRVLFLLLMLLGLVVRISNYPQILSPDGSFIFYGPDAFYQLRRMVYFLQNFPDAMSFDPMLSWPEGSSVPWPEGFIFIMGLPLKILGINSAIAMEWALNIETVLIGLLTMGLIYILSLRVLEDKKLALMVLAISAVNFLLVTHSSFGQFDHHIFEILFAVVALILMMKTFIDEDKLSAYLLGAWFSFCLLISSSGLFVIFASFFVIALIWNHRRFQSQTLKVTSVLILFLLAYTILSHQWMTIVKPSFFHMICVILCSIITLAGRFFKLSMRILGISLALGLVLYLVLPEAFLAHLQNAFVYVFSGGVILNRIAEVESPLFYDGHFTLGYVFANLGYLVLLLPMIIVGLYKWNFLKVSERALHIFLLVLSIFCFTQSRFTHLFLGIYIIYIIWLLKMSLEVLKARSVFVCKILPFAFLGFMILPSIHLGFSPELSSEQKAQFAMVGRLKQELNIADHVVWSNLGLKSFKGSGFFSHPDLAHLIRYKLGAAAIVDSFFLNGLEKDYLMRTAKTDLDLEALLQRYKIKYLVLDSDSNWLYRLQMIWDPSESEAQRISKVLADTAYRRWLDQDYIPKGRQVLNLSIQRNSNSIKYKVIERME